MVTRPLSATGLLHLIRYDDGLIDDGEFIVLYDLDYSILEAFSSSRRFVFVLKLKVCTDLAHLLICSYAKFRLLNKIQCCCNVLPYLSSLRAPHIHIIFQSPAHWKIVAFTILAAKNKTGNY